MHLDLLKGREQLIYFPAMSTGIPPVGDTVYNITKYFRVWEDYIPPEYRYPFILTSAGYNYKATNYRKDFNMENTLVFGDSGGFQIATGALKWKEELRENIFNWLENNTDIAANIDIPPLFSLEGQFNKSLELSMNNFEWFEKHQTGKTKYLTVSQGTTPDQINKWFEACNHFHFNGWALNTAMGKLNVIIYKICWLLEHGEFDKENVIWVHILGVTRVSHMLLVNKLAILINEYTNGRVHVSLDSSSFSGYAFRGRLILDINWKDMTTYTVHCDKNTDYEKFKGIDIKAFFRVPLPTVDLGDFNGFHIPPGTTSVKLLAILNLYKYIEINNKSYALLKMPKTLQEDFIEKSLYKVLQSLDEIFENPKNAINIYFKYAHLYETFSAFKPQSDNKVFNNFFN